MARSLLILTALIEAATGIALLAAPSLPVSFLLGTALDAPGLSVARVAGAAVLSLGLACWLARDAGASRPGRAVIAAMLLYNVLIVAVLSRARLAFGLTGVGFWPVAALHTALAIWCITCLRTLPPDQGALTS